MFVVSRPLLYTRCGKHLQKSVKRNGRLRVIMYWTMCMKSDRWWTMTKFINSLSVYRELIVTDRSKQVRPRSEHLDSAQERSPKWIVICSSLTDHTPWWTYVAKCWREEWDEPQDITHGEATLVHLRHRNAANLIQNTIMGFLQPACRKTKTEFLAWCN